MKKADSKSNLNLDICRIIDYILRIIIILMIIIKLINQQYNDIGILLLTFFLTYYNFAFEKLFKIKLRKSSRFMLTIFIFLAQCLGTSLNFYDKFYSWDLMLHFYSGVLVFMIGLDIYQKIYDDKKIILMLLFSGLFSLAIANIWEIMEFSYDGILNMDTQRSGNLVGRLALKDTMTDLIASTSGTIFISIISYIKYYIMKKKK